MRPLRRPYTHSSRAASGKFPHRTPPHSPAAQHKSTQTAPYTAHDLDGAPQTSACDTNETPPGLAQSCTAKSPPTQSSATPPPSLRPPPTESTAHASEQSP